MKKFKPRPSRKPIKIQPRGGCDEAWFYESPKSISVYTYNKGVGCQAARIKLSQIETWLKRVLP